jgi:hypothetical protein
MICHKIGIWTIFPPIYACHSKYEISNCLWLWLYEYTLGNASLFPNGPPSCYSRGLHDHGLQDSGKIRWPQGHPDPDGLRLHPVRTNLVSRLNFVQEYVEIVASLNSLKKKIITINFWSNYDWTHCQACPLQPNSKKIKNEKASSLKDCAMNNNSYKLMTA